MQSHNLKRAEELKPAPADLSSEREVRFIDNTANAEAPALKTYAGIALTAASTLLFQIALTRIFAVLLWAHLAFMVVGTALFGFGLSGVLLALRPIHNSRQKSLLSLLSLGMSASMIAAYLVITNIPFRMYAFREEPVQFFYLAIWYVALLLPFFLGGLIVAALLARYSEHCAKLYGIDLLGAAAGSLLLIPVISNFGGEGAVVISAMLAAGAGLCYLAPRSRGVLVLLALTVLSLALILPKADQVLPLKFHQTKRRFNQAVQHNHIYATRWSPISRVDVSYHKDDMLDIWIDGGTNESAILRWTGNTDKLRPMAWSTIGTVYDLKRGQDPNVLIIGPSGGKEVLFAISHGAKHVDAVEMDPSIVELVNYPQFSKFMGRLYQHERVTLYNDEGRSFVRRQPDQSYDVIQFVNNYTPVAIASGALNLSAAFLLTKEALNDYLNKLTDNGVLALHRGATLRVALMALEVLYERGVKEPWKHILISSGEVPYFDGFFLKNAPWTEEEVTRVSRYLNGRILKGPKFLWNPFAPDTNSIYGQLMSSPKSEFPKYYTDLGVNLFPATDDRPFVEHFLQLGRPKIDPSLPSEFKNREKEKWRGIIPRGDFPYVAILVESAVLSLVFLVLPLTFFARSSFKQAHFPRMLCFFACLGFGFIVIEICLMKRYVLFLGNPAYSISTILVVLLLGAGVGSMAVSRLQKAFPAERLIKAAIPLIIIGLLLETFLSPIIVELFLAQEFPIRIGIASALLFPIGFLLGMPFPLGMELIRKHTDDPLERKKIVAWAWGVNGYTTVIGSAATVFIALFAGFKIALGTAMLTYLIALLAVRSLCEK